MDYSALERTCKSPKGDPRSDIYFLGCVFYQMLTGQLPMEESESKDMLKKMLVRSFGAIKPISEHPYAPDEELSEIIEKMMKIDLKGRYQTMDQVVADLERYQASHDAATGQAAVAASRDDEDDGFDSIFIKPVEEVPVVEAAARALAVRGEGRGAEEHPLRRGPGRDPGRPAEDPHEDGLSRTGGPRRRAGRRAIPRVAGRCRDLRYRRPG